jgi:hypothetical protein
MFKYSFLCLFLDIYFKLDTNTIFLWLTNVFLLCLRVNEWLLFNTKWTVCDYILARTSYIRWDNDDVHFALDQQAELDLYNRNYSAILATLQITSYALGV